MHQAKGHKNNVYQKKLFKSFKVQPPYGRLLSSSCVGLQPLAATEGPFGPKGDFGGRTTGLRELDIESYLY